MRSERRSVRGLLVSFRGNDSEQTLVIHFDNLISGSGVKSYPRGVTTNSDGGIESYEAYYHVFEAMEEEGLVLNLHGEIPSDAKTVSICWCPLTLGLNEPSEHMCAQCRGAIPPSLGLITQALPEASDRARTRYDARGGGGCQESRRYNWLQHHSPSPRAYRRRLGWTVISLLQTCCQVPR